MPFTPSHAVVALPFVRTPLLPAAIAIGAMTPDLPLFLRGTPLSYQATHTNVALSTAIAFVLLVLWYALLRPAVRELAPLAVARRLPPEWDATGSNVLRTLPPRHPVALAILAIWATWWISRRTPAASVVRVLPGAARRAWWASLPVILAAAWGFGLLAYGPLTATWTAQHLAYRVLPPACAVWGVVTIALCVAVIARRSRVRRA